MKEIIVVQSTKGKIASVQNELNDTTVLDDDLAFIESITDDINEKTLKLYKITGKPCNDMDTGFYLCT